MIYSLKAENSTDFLYAFKIFNYLIYNKLAKYYYAKIIFLNASTIATAAILLKSISKRFPNGLGNESDQVGRNLMDHFTFSGAKAEHPGLKEKYYYGKRPSGIYVPRFQNTNPETMRKEFVRGYGYQGIGERLDWNENSKIDDFGISYKEKLTTPGPWTMILGTYGETLPYENNRITLDKENRTNGANPSYISLLNTVQMKTP